MQLVSTPCRLAGRHLLIQPITGSMSHLNNCSPLINPTVCINTSINPLVQRNCINIRIHFYGILAILSGL